MNNYKKHLAPKHVITGATKKRYQLVEMQDDYAVFMESDADPTDFEKRIIVQR